ncbi:hypothetical protein [Blastochloris viridis]|uniref:hypothetical protein n=1 Tax=Blastochloris viridis TaxID=1079 RepID=UPI0006D77558
MRALGQLRRSFRTAAPARPCGLRRCLWPPRGRFARERSHFLVSHPRSDAARKTEIAREAKTRRAAEYRSGEGGRYDQRSSAERVNVNLKDNHGGSTVRVSGAAKVMCHLMFGILVVAALQTVRRLV